MEKIVTVEGPFIVEGVTLIAVVRSSLMCKYSDKGIWLFGFKLPIAIVLLSGSSKLAFRANGEKISIQQLLTENPEISIDL